MQTLKGRQYVQEETLDPKATKLADTKEGLYFGREVAADDPEALSTPLTGPNQVAF